MISAKVIADSISMDGARITTFELIYPRFIHGEVMTHRMFSRNAMSSRAIPVAKVISQVELNPAMPVHWGANQPGMQANVELDTQTAELVRQAWLSAAEWAVHHARVMVDLGAHKQIVNRVLEPFQWMRTIVTATEWSNFFALRAHPDAQPEFQVLARAMLTSLTSSAIVRGGQYGESSWHLPYVSSDERKNLPGDLLPKLSAARCARVSYLTHDGEKPDVEKDLSLFNRLVGSVPLHASPIEHQACPAATATSRSNNFIGWKQYRDIYENGML